MKKPLRMQGIKTGSKKKTNPNQRVHSEYKIITYMENKKTFLNKNNLPIIRRCQNCKFWDKLNKNEQKNILGYCKLISLYFSSTLEPTVFGMTKNFYLCEKHEFFNEEYLKENSKEVNLKESLKNKKEIGF